MVRWDEAMVVLVMGRGWFSLLFAGHFQWLAIVV